MAIPYKASVQLKMVNNSGGTLEKGDLVVLDLVNNNSVTTTTTQGDDLVIGVCILKVTNGKTGRIMVSGVGLVNVGPTAVAKGDRLIASATPGKVDPVGPDGYGTADTASGSIVGVALEAAGPGEQVLALIYKA